VIVLLTKQGENIVPPIIPKIPNVLTGCAGEHFVAYRLSAMGYLVALTRGGSPSVDLMVGTPNGQKTATIQVKTAIKAFSAATKKNPISCWYWRLTSKAKDLCGESVFYAFVDLRGGAGEPSKPMLWKRTRMNGTRLGV